MKFLVVDDSPTLRRVITTSLKTIGYVKIFEACDGSDALQRLQEENIDFLITDWNMPNMNGLELVKAVRASAEFSNLPVLMVTTRGNKDDVIEAVKARINNYIVKPFTPDVLKCKIDAVLATLKKI